MDFTYIKLLNICFVSSEVREFAKLIKEQYTAAQAHHFNYKKKDNNNIGIEFQYKK